MHQAVSLAVYCENQKWLDKSRELASHLNIPVSESLSSQFDYFLCLDQKKLQLQSGKSPKLKPIYAEFVRGASGYRRAHDITRRRPLLRALAAKKNSSIEIIDATAGLGRDAFELALAGCKVLMLERSTVVASLLQDGLLRLRAASNMNFEIQLVEIDAKEYLDRLPINARPDAIYLDPMYPERSQSALVKKEMRFLREIVGDDLDAEELLNAALACAKMRVVVKRSKHAHPLPGPNPNASINGKTTRYDIYSAAAQQLEVNQSR